MNKTKTGIANRWTKNELRQPLTSNSPTIKVENIPPNPSQALCKPITFANSSPSKKVVANEKSKG